MMLSIVLPTKNEEGHIESFCEQLQFSFQDIVEIEIIVVDASDDNSWEILVNLSKRHANIRLLRQQTIGFSGAVGEGLLAATGDWLLSMNSDGNHRIKDAVHLFTQRKEGTLLVGSRFIVGGNTEESYIRYLLSLCASSAIGLIAKSGLRENFSSFFLLPKSMLDSCPISLLFKGKGEGMLRLVCHLRQRNIPIVEHPVVYGRRWSGESKTDLISFLFDYTICAKKIRPTTQRSFLFGILQFVPLFFLVFLYQNDPDIFARLYQNLHLLLVGFIGFTISVLFRAFRMKSVVSSWQRQLTVSAIFGDIVLARYWNETIPFRLGEVARVERMRRRDNIDITSILMMILWEKCVGISTGCIGLCILLSIAIGLGNEQDNPVVLLGAAILTLLFTLGFWIVVRFVYNNISSLVFSSKNFLRSMQEIQELRVGLLAPNWNLQLPIGQLVTKAAIWLPSKQQLQQLLSARQLTQTILYSIGVWGWVALVLIVLARMIGIDLYATALAATAFTTGVTTQVRILPGAFGQVELTQVALLSFFGVALEPALLLASLYVILLRITNILLGLMRLVVFRYESSPMKGDQ